MIFFDSDLAAVDPKIAKLFCNSKLLANLVKEANEAGLQGHKIIGMTDCQHPLSAATMIQFHTVRMGPIPWIQKNIILPALRAVKIKADK